MEIFSLVPWIVWLLAIFQWRPWTTLVSWQFSNWGQRPTRFLLDWGFVGIAPLVALTDTFFAVWPRLAIICSVTVVTSIWRWRTPGSWRAYEPPLEG